MKQHHLKLEPCNFLMTDGGKDYDKNIGERSR